MSRLASQTVSLAQWVNLTTQCVTWTRCTLSNPEHGAVVITAAMVWKCRWCWTTSDTPTSTKTHNTPTPKQQSTIRTDRVTAAVTTKQIRTQHICGRSNGSVESTMWISAVAGAARWITIALDLYRRAWVLCWDLKNRNRSDTPTLDTKLLCN